MQLKATLLALCVFIATLNVHAQSSSIEYHVLATQKTSTMEKELNQAAKDGFRFQTVMGGETALGGHEVVAVLSRSGESRAHFLYKLLATNRTSTMQKELEAAADDGFEYKAQTVFNTAFGGDEVVCILEKEEGNIGRRSDYKLVATTKTSTFNKELNAQGSLGFQIVGMTVGKTAAGGEELVAIMRRPR
jgi:hypothetical protein